MGLYPAEKMPYIELGEKKDVLDNDPLFLIRFCSVLAKLLHAYEIQCIQYSFLNIV